jgi:ribosomal protein L11 methylase PrmA
MHYNSVLKNSSQIDEAVKYLNSLNLFPHSDRVKSWDVSKMIDIINKANRKSSILDVGCNGSPILLMLKSLGFTELYGCDFFLMHLAIHNRE